MQILHRGMQRGPEYTRYRSAHPNQVLQKSELFLFVSSAPATKKRQKISKYLFCFLKRYATDQNTNGSHDELLQYFQEQGILRGSGYYTPYKSVVKLDQKKATTKLGCGYRCPE